MEYGSSINELVASNIRSARAKKGLKQKEVAELVNLSVHQYGLYERGSASITVKFLGELALLFDVEIVDFFNKKGDNEQEFIKTFKVFVRNAISENKETEN